jgi:hypothetical protein
MFRASDSANKKAPFSGAFLKSFGYQQHLQLPQEPPPLAGFWGAQ